MRESSSVFKVWTALRLNHSPISLGNSKTNQFRMKSFRTSVQFFNPVMTDSKTDLQRLKEDYTSHFVQAVKLKSIHKDQERFKCSVIENSRRISEKIKKSEMAKCIEPCVLLRINYNAFKTLILPLIEQDLEVKLFCLHRLQFLSVVSSQPRDSRLRS